MTHSSEIHPDLQVFIRGKDQSRVRQASPALNWRERHRIAVGVMGAIALVVAVVRVTGLGGQRWWGGGAGEDAIPNDPESAVGFVCTSCGAKFGLTPHEICHAFEAGKFAGSLGDLQTRLMECAVCGKFAAVRDTPQVPAVRWSSADGGR